MTTPGGSPAQPTGARVVRNTAWNLAGIAVPLAVGLLAIPVTISALGAARFGMLGIAWVVLEYLSLLDAGLGRATVYHVARTRAIGQPLPNGAVTASLLTQTAIGMAGAAILWAAAPWLVAQVLTMPPGLENEARASLRVVAATLPLVLLGVGLRGLLEAAERFDLAAAIRIPATAATLVVPALLAPLGASLPEILTVLLATRALACAVSWRLARRALVGLHCARPEWRALRPLASYGGWLAVSSVVAGALLYFDRLVLGAVAGLAAVGVYVAPFEAASRLLAIPGAVSGAAFPAATAAAARGAPALAALTARTARLLLAVMAPPVVVGVLLAPQLLTLWLGAELATYTTLPLRLLLPGVLLGAIAHVPSLALLALGRSGALAAVHVATAAVHVPATIVLIQTYGVPGAAAAWSLRAVVDAALLIVLYRRHMPRAQAATAGVTRHGGMLVAFAVLATPAALVMVVNGGIAAAITAAVAGIALYGAAVWRWMLSDNERAEVAAYFAARRRGGGSATAGHRSRSP